MKRLLPRARSRGSRPPPLSLFIFLPSRVGVIGKEVNRQMSVRRRWRIGSVRRSLGSPARRAIVLPRARFV